MTKRMTTTIHYQPQNFDFLLGATGFSDELLKNHFKLYEGYVKNTNELIDTFASYEDSDRSKDQAFADHKRRFAWEFNGMRLHEYYFGNMTKNFMLPNPENRLSEKISEDFGSFENWRHEFSSVGAMRGVGWALLAYDGDADRLFNLWINEHDLGILIGAEPLLVMDVFEHAFLTDYGLERDQYISAFMGAIDWLEVGSRFETPREGRVS